VLKNRAGNKPHYTSNKGLLIEEKAINRVEG